MLQNRGRVHGFLLNTETTLAQSFRWIQDDAVAY
jgi:hypothetical protein